MEDYPFYWSSTTHAHFLGGTNGAYASFGRAMGYMDWSWMDVHGAGAPRSDPMPCSGVGSPHGRCHRFEDGWFRASPITCRIRGNQTLS